MGAEADPPLGPLPPHREERGIRVRLPGRDAVEKQLDGAAVPTFADVPDQFLATIDERDELFGDLVRGKGNCEQISLSLFVAFRTFRSETAIAHKLVITVIISRERVRRY